MKDYYAVLGTNKNASYEEIKRAFRRLAMRYHPDRNPDNSLEAAEIFKNINEAYEVLSDNSKRQQYDHMVSWTEPRRESFEEYYSTKDFADLDCNNLKGIMHHFVGADYTKFRGCNRSAQKGWRCRRQRWQE